MEKGKAVLYVANMAGACREGNEWRARTDFNVSNQLS